MIVFHICRDFNIIAVAQNGNCLLISDFVYEYDAGGWLGVSYGARIHKNVLWNLDVPNYIIQTGNNFVGRKHGFITGVLYKISAKLHRPREKWFVFVIPIIIWIIWLEWLKLQIQTKVKNILIYKKTSWTSFSMYGSKYFLTIYPKSHIFH